MHTKIPRLFAVAGVVALTTMTSGCAVLLDLSQQYNQYRADRLEQKLDRELEQVANRWFKTIRASQVIPVYPVTEDLQPGDIFLVTTPVDRQQDEWKKRGYVALDKHIGRMDLKPASKQEEGVYEKFYKQSFTHKTKELPKSWIDEEWVNAPRAYFPAYSFDVSESGGIKAGLPISGLPIGLSLLGAGDASVSVQITDARTLGLDIASLYERMQKNERGVKSDFIRLYVSGKENKPNYIRVVNRVYLAKSVDIGIRRSQVSGGGISAGAIPTSPVDLIVPSKGDDSGKSVKTYKDNIDKITKSIEGISASANVDYEKNLEDINTSVANLKQQMIEKEQMDEKLRKELTTKFEAIEKLIETGKSLEGNIGRKNQLMKINEAVKQLGKVVQSRIQDTKDKTAYNEGIEKIKDLAKEGISASAPGVTISALAASKDSITLREEFARPMVIGYLAFDREILPGGLLGPPIPTLATLREDEDITVRRSEVDLSYFLKTSLLFMRRCKETGGLCNSDEKTEATKLLSLIEYKANYFLKETLKYNVKPTSGKPKNPIDVFFSMRENMPIYEGKSCKELKEDVDPFYDCYEVYDELESKDGHRFPSNENFREKMNIWIIENENLIREINKFVILKCQSSNAQPCAGGK